MALLQSARRSSVDLHDIRPEATVLVLQLKPNTRADAFDKDYDTAWCNIGELAYELCPELMCLNLTRLGHDVSPNA